MPLHHISIYVADLARSKAFYDPLLKVLGYKAIFEYDTVVYYGPVATGAPEFGITCDPIKQAGHAHVAFAAASRELVDEFFAVAVANGGTDNGKPGIRAHYSPTYYGAFVLDPDGHNIEAVIA